MADAQTLTIGVRAGPDSIDPHFTASGTHAEALKHVFDSLTWSGDGLEIEQLEPGRHTATVYWWDEAGPAPNAYDDATGAFSWSFTVG